MSASEARIRANQQNALKSTGPKTAEGKERSKQNSFKHGLAGQGVVMPAADFAEVQRREVALQAEMAPRTVIGAILVRQLATLSVRMERGAQQEFAAVAERSRQAVVIYDQERTNAAEALFDQLASDPRRVLQRLRKTPEGIERMLIAWRELRDELVLPRNPNWTGEHLMKLANLLGFAHTSTAGARLAAVTRATWGDFGKLESDEQTAMEPLERRAWARAVLLERIDAGIAELEAVREALDHESFEQNRAEAGERALFDASREATLARRYESEARRAFFKALNEFRKVESEVVEAETSEPESAESGELGSSRESGEVNDCRVAPRANPPVRPGSFESDRAQEPPVETREGRKAKRRRLAAVA